MNQDENKVTLAKEEPASSAAPSSEKSIATMSPEMKEAYQKAKNHKKLKTVEKYFAICVFLLPALALFIGILIAPIAMSLYYSLFNWDGMAETKEFINIANYVELFTSTNINFLRALGNACILAILSVFIQLPISLALALILGRGIKGERFFITVFFMPVLISSVVIGQLWLKVYNPDYGLLNMAIRGIDSILEKILSREVPVDQLAMVWLGNKNTALAAVFIPTLWQFVGYHMLLMYAGVRSVSPELREAAKIDGATDTQVDWYVVIPSMRQILRVSVIFAVTGSLKSFDMIYILMSGKPWVATDVPSTLMINYLFTRNRYGMGSAMAVVMIVLCFAFALLINLIFKERESHGKHSVQK